MLVSPPITYDKRFGIIGSVVDMDYLIRRLHQVGLTGFLAPCGRDSRKDDVAGSQPPGNMPPAKTSATSILRRVLWMKARKRSRLPPANLPFETTKRTTEMLETYIRRVRSIGRSSYKNRAKKRYRGIHANAMHGPLAGIAGGISQCRVEYPVSAAIPVPCKCWHNPVGPSRAAISPSECMLKRVPRSGELATTFNTMSEELEQFVEDLKRAAEENKALFMGSIQMLAGAVDEKDPYTRGHSDRVTKYSLMIAKEMGLDAAFLEICDLGCNYMTFGKIGIEDPHPKTGRADAGRI